MKKSTPFFGKTDIPLFQARCDTPGCEMLSGLNTTEQGLDAGLKAEGWKTVKALPAQRNSQDGSNYKSDKVHKCNFCVEKELTNLTLGVY